MRDRRSSLSRVAWLAAVTGAVTMVARCLHRGRPSRQPASLVFGFVGLALAGVSDASVGAVLTLRRPGNVIGLVLLLAAILLPLTFLGFIGGAVTEGQGSHDVLAGLSALLGSLGIVPTLIIAGPLLALLFPDGRLPGPRWRWPVGAIAVMVALGSVIVVLRPGPVGDSLADNPFGLADVSASEPFWALGESLALAAFRLHCSSRWRR